MAYVSAEDRRAQAREVARRHMREGARYEDLSLRDIAKELGVALSTLTYAYQSIGDLMDDFDLVFHAELMTQVGNGGLREELRRYVDGSYRMVSSDPALMEISRYRLSQIGDGHQTARLEGTLELFTAIRRRGRENYRLPDDLMAELFFSQTTGAFTVWFDGGESAGPEWYRWMIAAIDILTIAADPRPIGQPHADPPFPLPDYALLQPPAVEAG